MDINELCINCFKPTGGEEVCMHCGHIQTDTPRQLCHLYPHTILNNRYVIGGDINNGGFGVVYKAYDLKLETVVAVKELLPTQNSIVNRMPGTTDVIPVGDKRAEQFEALKHKFLEEARMMAQFSNNDGIVHIYDFFECNNTAYHVMEYLEGQNLREFLNQNSNQIDYDKAISIMLPIMEILKVAHKNNVIHCDISPDNIFICNNGKVKLIDFGAAKFSNSTTKEEEGIVAKPGYTPPEQYRKNSEIGPYTDIYAVGAVLYRLLSGNVPDESIDRIEKDELQKLSKSGVQLPLHADKSIMKALALRESARFKTMDDFIRSITGEKKAYFPEEEIRKKKIIRGVSVAAAFVVMIASVFITYIIKNNNSLLPAKSEQITMWYIDNGDAELNERWENIEILFADYVKEQKDELSGTKVEIVGIPADKYDKELEKAFKNGDAPDIYESSNTDFDGYANSLDSLYKELKDSEYKDAFDVMKSHYKKNNKIAFYFDTPVLYTYTDFKYIEAPKADDKISLDSLIDAKINKGDFKHSLLVNPDALLYASYAYGYVPGGDTKVVKKLFDTDRIFNKNEFVSPDSVFVSQKDNSMYYIGMMSEFSTISKNSRAGQASFDVTPLISDTDIYDFYVFPEVFSVSKRSSSSKKQTATLLLYFLISEADGQKDITKRDNNTYYLPMLNKAVDDIGYISKYNKIYDSKMDPIELNTSDYISVMDSAKEIADITKKKNAQFKEIESVLKNND